MKLYELINPSDQYTFRAPSIEIAGAAVCLISSQCGAQELPDGESTPVLFGWDGWLKDRGIDNEWIEAHYAEIADALDSFLIGSAEERAEAERAMALMTPENAAIYRDQRQDRKRTSLSRIGETAYHNAKKIREYLQRKESEQP